MFNNKNASIVAVILLSIVALTTFIIYSQNFFEPISLDLTKKEELRGEIDTAMQKAISLGIMDFLNNGFSNQNKVWYCNYPYTPYLNESNKSIHSMIDFRVEQTLDIFRDEGITIKKPNISVDVENLNESYLKENSVNVELSNLLVGIETSDLKVIQDLGKTYSFDWPVWKMYKTLQEWSENNSGDITNEIYKSAFENRACQAISSSCDCYEDKIIRDEIIDNISLKMEQIYPALNKSLNKLNEKFNGTGISCKYIIDKSHIENIERIDYGYSMTSYLDDSTDIIEFDKSVYDYNYTHYLDTFTLPNLGGDSNGGCPTFNSSVNATFREKRTTFETTIKDTPFSNLSSESCANSDLLIQKNEFLALDKKVGILLRIVCSDESILVSGEKNPKELSAEITLRVAVGMSCPLPKKEDITKEPAYTCGGGGGGGAVVTGTVMCDFPNECGNCEQCVLDESEPDGYACLPEPKGVTCDTCTVCDGAGACTEPQLGGFPDDCSGGSCQVCDGENTGSSACTSAIGDLYKPELNLACDGTCLLCDENANCNRVPDDFGLVDSSFCGSCQTCGADVLGSASCIANPLDDGEFVEGLECQICSEGVPVLVDDGTIDNNFCGTCEVCSGGTCQFDPVLSTTPSVSAQCNNCQTCGQDGSGEGACISDISKNGVVCGNSGCSICDDGSCSGSPSTLGQVCNEKNGCTTTCDSNGKCSDGSLTEGQSCSKNFASCISEGFCNSKGSCIGGIAEGTQCCGDLVCNSGDACCPNGGGLDIWTCSACDDGTT